MSFIDVTNLDCPTTPSALDNTSNIHTVPPNGAESCHSVLQQSVGDGTGELTNPDAQVECDEEINLRLWIIFLVASQIQLGERNTQHSGFISCKDHQNEGYSADDKDDNTHDDEDDDVYDNSHSVDNIYDDTLDNDTRDDENKEDDPYDDEGHTMNSEDDDTHSADNEDGDIHNEDGDIHDDVGYAADNGDNDVHDDEGYAADNGDDDIHDDDEGYAADGDKDIHDDKGHSGKGHRDEGHGDNKPNGGKVHRRHNRKVFDEGNIEFSEDEETEGMKLLAETAIVIKDSEGAPQAATASVDTGAGSSFISKKTVEFYGLKERPLMKNDIINFTNPISHKKCKPNTFVAVLLQSKKLGLGDFVAAKLRVLDGAGFDIILGRPFIGKHRILAPKFNRHGKPLWTLISKRSKAQQSQDREAKEKDRAIALMLETGGSTSGTSSATDSYTSPRDTSTSRQSKASSKTSWTTEFNNRPLGDRLKKPNMTR